MKPFSPEQREGVMFTPDWWCAVRAGAYMTAVAAELAGKPIEKARYMALHNFCLGRFFLADRRGK